LGLRPPTARCAQRGRVLGVDEGLPIAYQVADEGIPVYASDGVQVGTVDHAVAAPAEEIFHGIVMRVEATRRFVAADQVASSHEHGVDLRIDAVSVAALPEPHGAAPAWRDREPGVNQAAGRTWLTCSLARIHRRDWIEEDQ
jgi:hypothetical protein